MVVIKKETGLLSINEFRKNYNLSRDTVFAGLSELKSKGIIDSTPGVGYYIATTRIAQKLNVFLLFNEFNEFKEDLYNSFMSSIKKTANVDLYFHNYNRKVFETLINEANYKYTTYILMPGKFTNIAPLLESLSGRSSYSTTFTRNWQANTPPLHRISRKTLTKLWYTDSRT